MPQSCLKCALRMFRGNEQTRTTTCHSIDRSADCSGGSPHPAAPALPVLWLLPVLTTAEEGPRCRANRGILIFIIRPLANQGQEESSEIRRFGGIVARPINSRPVDVAESG